MLSIHERNVQLLTQSLYAVPREPLAIFIQKQNESAYSLLLAAKRDPYNPKRFFIFEEKKELFPSALKQTIDWDTTYAKICEWITNMQEAVEGIAVPSLAPGFSGPPIFLCERYTEIWVEYRGEERFSGGSLCWREPFLLGPQELISQLDQLEQYIKKERKLKNNQARLVELLEETKEVEAQIALLEEELKLLEPTKK